MLWDFLKGFAITLIVLLYLFIPACICFETEIPGYGVLWLVFNLLAIGVGFNYSYYTSNITSELNNNFPALVRYDGDSYNLESIYKRNNKIIAVYQDSDIMADW